MKVRRRTEETFDAYQVPDWQSGDPLPPVVCVCPSWPDKHIHTPDGRMPVYSGDWVTVDEQGVVDVHMADRFVHRFEPAPQMTATEDAVAVTEIEQAALSEGETVSIDITALPRQEGLEAGGSGR
jgi:hypothetical protein